VDVKSGCGCQQQSEEQREESNPSSRSVLVSVESRILRTKLGSCRRCIRYCTAIVLLSWTSSFLLQSHLPVIAALFSVIALTGSLLLLGHALAYTYRLRKY